MRERERIEGWGSSWRRKVKRREEMATGRAVCEGAGRDFRAYADEWE